MIKTEFMNLYEELCLLNEAVHNNFEKNLVPKIKTLEPKLDKAIKALDNPNYVEIQEILKSLINGFKVCFSISKQITVINQNDQAINAPFDEAIGILNKIEDIIFRVEQDNTALDKYLKDKPTAWTAEDLKDSLKDYEKYSDVDISKLDFSAKEITSKPDTTEQPAEEVTTKQAEPKNTKLNRARHNNIKIIKAFKEVGLPADDLTVTAKNKNGKDYRKASDKLNKLRKTLFGEALDDENVFDQEF